MSKKLSQKISLLSFICSIFVVWLHCSVPPSDTQSCEYMIYDFLENCVVTLAVPYFFIVSGFFLAGKMENTGWWCCETKKRCSSLLLPFLYWNLISILFLDIMLTCGANLAHGRLFCDGVAVCEKGGFLRVLFSFFWKHPPNGNTWYLRSLFLLVLISPILKWALKRFGQIFLVSTFVIYVLISPDQIQVGDWWVPASIAYQLWGVFSLKGLFFFVLGMYLRNYPMRIGRFGIALSLIVYVISVLCAGLLHYNGFSYVHYWVSPIPFAILGGLVLLWHCVPRITLSKALLGASFFIYLFHHPMIFVAGIFTKRLPPVLNSGLLYSVINFVFVLALTLGGWFAISRVPKMRAWLLGGR